LLAAINSAVQQTPHKEVLPSKNTSNIRSEISRSVASEYDYAVRKKFTDVLGTQSKASQL